MPYMIAKQGALAPPTLYPSPELAVAAGTELWGGEEFDVRQVREAALGDFMDIKNIMGDMREIMQAKCGRTDVVDDPQFIGESNMLGYYIEQAFNYFQEQYNISLDGYLIAERTIHVKPDENFKFEAQG